MNTSSLLKYLLYILLFLIYSSCTKYLNENSVNIQLVAGERIEVGTPFTVNYEIIGDKTDSVCLYINDQLVETHTELRNQFSYIPMKNGRNFLRVDLHYYGGLVKSKSINFDCKKYNQPKIYVDITRIDGDEEFFVGEELKIMPILNAYNYDIRECQEMEILLNNQSLGKVTEAPFEFYTHPISKPSNTFTIKYIDKLGGIRSYEFDYLFVNNTDPTIRFEFDFYHEENDVHIVENSVDFNISATDNLNVEKIEIIVNNQIYDSIIINQGYYHDEYVFDALESGVYEVYCKCYAERDQVVISDKLKLTRQDFITYDENYDLVGGLTSEDGKMVYIASKRGLYAVNYQTQKIFKNIAFEHDVSAIAYDKINKKIYVAHSNGFLSYFDENTMSSQLIDIEGLSRIDHIAVDHNHHILIDAGSDLYRYNLVTENLRNLNIHLRNCNYLYYDELNEHFFIETGDWDNTVYYIQLTENYYEIIGEAELGGYGNQILINPYNNDILLDDNDADTEVYKLNPFGEHKAKINSPHVPNYSYNYNYS